MYNKLLRLLILGMIVTLFNCLIASEARAVEKLYYIYSDHLGSTTVVTDENGSVISQQSYYPYGETRSSTSDLPTERQYTGQVSDQDQTGLYYYNARYYNPQIAKFTQADTVEGPNRYTYVGNNPLKHIDPSGHESESTWQNWWVQPQGSGGSDSNSSIGVVVVINKVDIENLGRDFKGWAVPGSSGPPNNPEVDMAPTFILGGFMAGLPLASAYGQWLVYDLLLNGGAGYLAAEKANIEQGPITLYKAIPDYDGGPVKSPVSRGLPPRGPSYLTREPRDPTEEVSQYLKNTGGTLDDLALRHAGSSGPFSPGISWTTDVKVAENFAEKIANRSGVPVSVLKTTLPTSSSKIRSIVEIYNRTGRLPNLPLEQVLYENEWVWYGGDIPVDWVRLINIITPAAPQ